MGSNLGCMACWLYDIKLNWVSFSCLSYICEKKGACIKFWKRRTALVKDLRLSSRSVNVAFPFFTPTKFTLNSCFLPPVQFAFATAGDFMVFSVEPFAFAKNDPICFLFVPASSILNHICFEESPTHAGCFLPWALLLDSLKPKKRVVSTSAVPAWNVESNVQFTEWLSPVTSAVFKDDHETLPVTS